MITPGFANAVPPSAIDHARQYPFAIPRHSFLYLDGKSWELDLNAAGNIEDAKVCVGLEGYVTLADVAKRSGQSPLALERNRVAVLSLGSNASPEQLGRKFSALAGPVLIPVIRGQLLDFDVVYSAHITRYGSVPAALASAPGTRVQLFVNLLDAAQLEVMHHSESLGRNYAFCRLEGIRLELEGGRTLDQVHFYRSHFGVLQDHGLPIALTAISAQGRRYPAMSEAEVLEWVRQRIAPEAGLDGFIASNIASEAHRQRHVAALAKWAAPVDFAYRDIAG